MEDFVAVVDDGDQPLSSLDVGDLALTRPNLSREIILRPPARLPPDEDLLRQPVALDLNDVVRGVAGVLERVAGERVALLLDLQPGLGSVLADRTQVERVLLNLVVNARDAMPEGGVLRIETRRERLAAPLEDEHQGVVPPALRWSAPDQAAERRSGDSTAPVGYWCTGVTSFAPRPTR